MMHVGEGADEFRELSQSGIGRNRTEVREFRELWNQTEAELITGAGPVPQCSKLRNRMYSRIDSLRN
jgi:hypothetical protein